MSPVGDRVTFERAYRTQGAFVADVLGRLAVPAEAVSDAVQDVFVAAYRRWDDFDPERPVRPWLTGFARRIAFRYRRSAARRHRKSAALVPLARDHERPTHHQADARDFLDRFLRELDEGHRRAFLLTELEGCTAAETAAVLGISSEAVYGRVRSVRRRLRHALLVEAREPDPRAAALVPAWAVLKARLGLGASLGAGPGLAARSIAALESTAIAVGLGLAGLGLVLVARPDATEPRSGAIEPSSRPDADERSRDAVEPVALVPPRPPTPAAATPRPAVITPAEPARRPARPSVPPPGGSLAQETALLRAAKAALDDGRAEAALVELQAHEHRFPQGQLADARRRTRIRALCDLGRIAQARGEAQHLARTRPDDPLAQQAVSICARPSAQGSTTRASSIQRPAVAEKDGSR